MSKRPKGNSIQDPQDPPKTVSKISVRRLAPNELDLVKDAQHFVPALGERLRNHRRWLRKTLHDLQVGRRHAVGAFVPKSDGNPRLIGCALFKPSATGIAEVKNLLVDPDQPQNDAVSAYVAILEFLERFARKRGYSEIHVELFVHSTSSLPLNPISILVQQKYSLQSVRPSTYFREDTFYGFSKLFPPAFLGDAEDHPEVSRWLLQSYFGFESVSSFGHIFSSGETFFACTFSIPYSCQDYTVSGVAIIDISRTAANRGVAYRLITEPSDHELRDQLRGGNQEIGEALLETAQIRVLISLYQAILPSTPNDSIWFLGPDKVADLLGTTGWQRRESPRGVLLELTPESLDECFQSPRSFTHFLLYSGFELYLAYTDSDAQDIYALLADNQRMPTTTLSATIWGVAKINLVLRRTLQSAYTSTGPSVRTWQPEDLAFFSGDHGVHDDGVRFVYVLEMGPPVKLESRIPLTSIFTASDLDLSTRYVTEKEWNTFERSQASAITEAVKLAIRKKDDKPSQDSAWYGSLLSLFSSAITILKGVQQPSFLPEFSPDVLNLLKQHTEDHMLRSEVDSINRSPEQPLLGGVFALCSQEDFDNANAILMKNTGSQTPYSCWCLRLKLAPFLRKISAKEIRDELSYQFPEKLYFKDVVQKELREIITPFFKLDGDVSAMLAERRRMIVEVFRANPDEWRTLLNAAEETLAFEFLNNKEPEIWLNQFIVPMKSADRQAKNGRERALLSAYHDRIESVEAALKAYVAVFEKD